MSRPIAMISSTARDLPEHREVMEHLTVMDKDAVETSLDMVDRAEVYIGVFAHWYGYVPDGVEKSITEMEYDRAVEKKIPRLIFFIDEDQPVQPKDFDTGPNATKLQALKDRIGKERVAAFFETAADLHGHVTADWKDSGKISKRPIGKAKLPPRVWASMRIRRQLSTSASRRSRASHPTSSSAKYERKSLNGSYQIRQTTPWD